jgi:hypothetical protein
MINKNFFVYAHDINGNSLAPLGEAVAIFGELNKRPNVAYGNFVDWVLASAERLTNFHQTFLIRILKRSFPDKKFKLHDVFVEAGFT